VVICNKDGIIASAIKIKPVDLKIGVYFLINSGEIVYIGKSTNIDGRITQHSATKEFDSFSWIELDGTNLENIEAEYIMAFNPRLNIRLPRSRFISQLMIKREYQIHMGKAKKALKLADASQYIFNGSVYYDRDEVNAILGGSE
jgi:excinuclease UvrABC nuclease subunit